jgi:hypothetical protein
MFSAAAHEHVRKMLEPLSTASESRRDRLQVINAGYEAVRRLRETLQDPAQALTDAVLLTVFFLTCSKYDNLVLTRPPRSRKHPLRNLQWMEVYCCFAPNKFHVDGLFQILSQKGGLETIHLQGLAEMISL